MVSTEPPTESVSFRTAAVRSPGLLIIRAHASLEYVKKIAYFAMGSSIDCAGLSRVDRIEPQLKPARKRAPPIIIPPGGGNETSVRHARVSCGQSSGPGTTFWLSRNTLSGSHARLRAASRSYFVSP